MLKKKLNIISTVVIIITMACNTAAYAAICNNSAKVTQNSKSIITENKIQSFRGHSKEEILKRLGISKEEFESAEKSGKTIFDMAKPKGYSEEDVKKIVIEVKSKAIDDKVKEGKLTKEKGEAIKVKIKEKAAKWDGTFKHSHKCQQISNFSSQLSIIH